MHTVAMSGPAGARARRGHRHPGVWLLAAGSLLVGLALAEILVRVFALGPEMSAVRRDQLRLSDDPILGYELVPGAPDPPDRINRFGMRDRPRTLERPPRSLRIANLGDSIAYGFGVRQAETYSRLLEAGSTGPDAPRRESLNFGVPGYDVAQTLRNLEVRALPFEPDVIVYQYCLNDPQHFSQEFAQLEARLGAPERRFRDRAAATSRLYALASYALERARPGDDASASGALPPDPQWSALRRGRWVDYFRALHHEPALWSRVERGLDTLADTARRHGAEVLVVVFPVFLQLDRYPLEDVHARVIAAARARGLATLDLLPVYRERRAAGDGHFVHNALHPDARGHAIAARAIAGALTREGWLASR